jgi:hypothetical protein
MDDESLISPERPQRKDPTSEKQMDYKRQRRASEGGKGWRKTVARLPRRERRLYRHAQERALREALSDAEAPGSTAGDSVRRIKRASFVELHHRREIPLGMRVSLKRAGIVRLMLWGRAGRRRGRNVVPPRYVLTNWVKNYRELHEK